MSALVCTAVRGSIVSRLAWFVCIRISPIVIAFPLLQIHSDSIIPYFTGLQELIAKLFTDTLLLYSNAICREYCSWRCISFCVWDVVWWFSEANKRKLAPEVGLKNIREVQINCSCAVVRTSYNKNCTRETARDICSDCSWSPRIDAVSACA